MTASLTYTLIFSGDTPAARVEALSLAATRLKDGRLRELDTSPQAAAVALRVTVRTADENTFDEAIARVGAQIAKGRFDGGVKLEDGTRVVLSIERGHTFSLVISGDAPSARADALKRAAARMKAEQLREIDTSVATDAVALRVTITKAVGEASFDQAIAIALREVGEGIAEAGWNVSAGGAAQIQLERRSKS
jgi:hypothetical protein